MSQLTQEAKGNSRIASSAGRASWKLVATAFLTYARGQ